MLVTWCGETRQAFGYPVDRTECDLNLKLLCGSRGRYLPELALVGGCLPGEPGSSETRVMGILNHEPAFRGPSGQQLCTEIFAESRM